MCNDAVIRNNTLMGKPTEGALIALAMKVCASLYSLTYKNITLTKVCEAMNFSITGCRYRVKKTHCFVVFTAI